MSTVDGSSAIANLRTWQDALLEEHGKQPLFSKSGPENVTILSYFYRPADQVAEKFKYLACAIFETWRHCGTMKTVLVINEMSDEVASFARQFAELVTVQTEPALTPGGVDCMSVDCNSKLWQRFSTPYVLIVQDDGFPLRSGLERFIGKYDFLGSPFRRKSLKGTIANALLRHCPANGGFSLRTRKICKLAAEYWKRHYENLPFGPEQVEDIFYTDTLPRRFLSYRLHTRVAGPRIASEFCYDGCLPENIIDNPFGFHSARAFNELLKNGTIKMHATESFNQ